MRALVAIVGTATLFASALADSAPQPWAFVKSVGGIIVEDPVPVGGRWILPVQANVSGLQSFSSKPTTLNSGLSCTSVRARVTGNRINLTIYTEVAESASSGVCPSASLGVLPAGEYKVFYAHPDGVPMHLRDVRVGL
jgi:hypothetical protein